MHEDDAVPDDGRRETHNERADRNWDELMQELRVTQTGTQILTGFLLTIPFQQRFADLDAYQEDLYLVLVAMAVLATTLITAPASLHRVLFRQRLKPELVSAGNRLARAGLVVLALVMAGSAMLVFDVVLTRAAGLTVGIVSIAVITAVWWVFPKLLARGTQE
ncbi:sodium:proton antiporter [Cellulomonas humilata]|uniref:Sodium:proton antiporter n=1 Tax=Cellulomonas humilata TaxID=144055 RepID=A0A7Y6A0X9_9CELL|nr:sodium:proton antiporter [Cellulomonas humilata]